MLVIVMKIAYIDFPLLFLPLRGGFVRKLRKHAKCNSKAGILRHNNKKDLVIPSLWMFKQGPIETDNTVERTSQIK